MTDKTNQTWTPGAAAVEMAAQTLHDQGNRTPTLDDLRPLAASVVDSLTGISDDRAKAEELALAALMFRFRVVGQPA